MPEQYADFKSLTGDTADIIKGVDKIGQKTAAALVNEFGTLENRELLPFALHELAYEYDGLITNEVLKGIRLK